MTDHSSLQWLLSTAHPDGSRVSGWALNAQNYDVTIKFIAGKENVVGDCLSRGAKDEAIAQEHGPLGARADIQERLVASAATVCAEWTEPWMFTLVHAAEVFTVSIEENNSRKEGGGSTPPAPPATITFFPHYSRASDVQQR